MTDHDLEWLIVGRVIKPHGVHGEVLVEIITDFPERMKAGHRFGLGASDGPEELLEVHTIRYHKGRWLLAVKGVRDRETIESWRGRFLFLPEQTLEELPEGFYYEHHLVGLQCESVEGDPLGEVVGFDPGEGQSRLLVRREGREFLVPYVPEIVTNVDLDRGVATLNPPSGLLDDDVEVVGRG